MEKSNFSFKGRFTLREINGCWSIYDRTIGGLVINSPTEHTFTKAEKMLFKYKAENEE